MSNDKQNPNTPSQSGASQKGSGEPSLPGPGENPDFPETDLGTGSGGNNAANQ